LLLYAKDLACSFAVEMMRAITILGFEEEHQGETAYWYAGPEHISDSLRGIRELKVASQTLSQFVDRLLSTVRHKGQSWGHVELDQTQVTHTESLILSRQELASIPPSSPWRSLLTSHLATEALRSTNTTWATSVLPREFRILNSTTKLIAPCLWSATASPMPDWVNQYDLCSPITGIPLPGFHCERWATDPWLRAVYMMPILCGKDLYSWFDDRSRSVLTSSLRQTSLMVLMPKETVWSSHFENNSPEHWNSHCSSALWDLTTKTVVYADGVHSRDALAKNGLSFEEWAHQSAHH
jgi:hypothetical protein